MREVVAQIARLFTPPRSSPSRVRPAPHGCSPARVGLRRLRDGGLRRPPGRPPGRAADPDPVLSVKVPGFLPRRRPLSRTAWCPRRFRAVRRCAVLASWAPVAAPGGVRCRFLERERCRSRPSPLLDAAPGREEALDLRRPTCDCHTAAPRPALRARADWPRGTSTSRVRQHDRGDQHLERGAGPRWCVMWDPTAAVSRQLRPSASANGQRRLCRRALFAWT